MKSKDDTATVLLGGEDTTIEMNQQQWRVWRYADPRGKNSDFWLKPDGSSDQNGSRSDGKDGIKINWGQGSPFDPPNTDIVNPLDYFATSGATQANFEAGKTYKFRVSADDALIIATRQIGKSNQNLITPLSQDRKQVEWQTFPNGIFKEYSWTPSQSGQYYVYFWHYDRTGDAGVDISWENTGQASSGSASTLITTSIPPGFNAIKNSKGVTLYESNNKSDYVQLVDLSQGASIKLLTGQPDNSEISGANNGKTPLFNKEGIADSWKNFSSQEFQAFSITNGVFFRKLDGDKSELSHPIKLNYSTVFDGTESRNRGKILKFEINNDSASITDFDDNINSINSSLYPQILGGLKEDFAGDFFSQNYRTSGRTFVGVDAG